MNNIIQLGKLKIQKKINGFKKHSKAILRYAGEFWTEESGMGVVEIVLIIIVLVGLVVVFKKQITTLVNSILTKMTNQANQI